MFRLFRRPRRSTLVLAIPPRPDRLVRDPAPPPLTDYTPPPPPDPGRRPPHALLQRLADRAGPRHHTPYWGG